MTVENELKWQDRSHDELKSIVRRGVQAGDMFFAASLEMERRAREAEAERDARQVVEVRTFKRLRWEVYVLIVLLVATLILLVR